MKALLFDLDGVFYVGDQLIEGALDTLNWCRQQNIPYLFITNTTSKPPGAIVDKLETLGIQAEISQILSPPVAAAQWLKSHEMKRVALYVVEKTRRVFSDFDLIKSEQEPVDAVVVGDLGAEWSYQVMNQAFRQLMQQPSPRLLALGMTRYWRSPTGLQLDAGAFVSALAYACGTEPLVLGKPAEAFFAMALERLEAKADETVMIGDDIKSDIGGAQQAGLHGVLVRTGKYQPADLELSIHPDAVIDSIAELPAWWVAQQR